MQVSVDGVVIEFAEGDITAQPDFNAVVNAANAQLLPGGGVAGAIHRSAGPGLAREASKQAPIRPGECVITAGHDLPNAHVIHCLGPVYGVDEPAADLLASCYRRAVELADEAGLAAVAFPAISTGVFGYPVEEAAEVAVRALAESAPTLRNVRRIRLVLRGPDALEAFRDAFERLRLLS